MLMNMKLSRAGLVSTAMLGFTTLFVPPSIPLQWVTTANAQATKPILEPITGNEELGDLSQPKQGLV
jgi:hypothetical protein